MDGFVDITVSLGPVTMTDSYKQKSDEVAMQTCCCQILPVTANVVAIYINIFLKKRRTNPSINYPKYSLISYNEKS